MCNHVTGKKQRTGTTHQTQCVAEQLIMNNFQQVTIRRLAINQLLIMNKTNNGYCARKMPVIINSARKNVSSH